MATRDTPGNRRRWQQLYEAGLNLGESEANAAFYATKALERELETGEYRVVPQSTEAIANDVP